MLTLTACGSGITGAPYSTLGRELAGVYNPTGAAAALDMRLVLGTRHNFSGRYEIPSGEVIRFYGTWVQRGNQAHLTVETQSGLPSELTFLVTRETILTKIDPGPFSMTPENAPLFLEQDIMRLRGAALIEGVQLDLDLVRVITDIVGAGGGGQNQN